MPLVLDDISGVKDLRPPHRVPQIRQIHPNLRYAPETALRTIRYRSETLRQCGWGEQASKRPVTLNT